MRETSDFFEEGIRLFNAERYFECHEALEHVWKRAEGAEKLFCQGLIQSAVALLHAERGNLRGAYLIYAKARAKLEQLPAIYLGIALADLLGALQLFFAGLKSDSQLPKRPRIGRAAG